MMRQIKSLDLKYYHLYLSQSTIIVFVNCCLEVQLRAYEQVAFFFSDVALSYFVHILLELQVYHVLPCRPRLICIFRLANYWLL
jgi:hypothetical protein